MNRKRIFFVSKRKPIWMLFILIAELTFSIPAQAQYTENSFNQQRFKTVVITEAVITTAGLIGLHYLWYKKFPRSRFHLFNDNAEWLNMDKIGHATTAYNISAIQYDMMRWSGLNNKNAALVGGLTSIGLQSIIEIFDGFSQGWGFSKRDMLANILGSTLFMGQQFAWGEQRMQLKFSFHKTIYAKYNPSELGANKWQSWLKDYNGQTYWLSLNPASFMKANTDFPSWFNVAVGLSADGMIGARSNPGKIGNLSIPDFKRTNKLLFSFDVDLKRFNNTTAPQTLLSIPSLLKLPAPALEIKKGAKSKYYWLYF